MSGQETTSISRELATKAGIDCKVSNLSKGVVSLMQTRSNLGPKPLEWNLWLFWSGPSRQDVLRRSQGLAQKPDGLPSQHLTCEIHQQKHRDRWQNRGGVQVDWIFFHQVPEATSFQEHEQH